MPSILRNRTRISFQAGLSSAAALLALLAVLSCGNRDSSMIASEVQCVRVNVPNLALMTDAACVVESNELAQHFLPDLGFTPGLCYTTGAVPVQIVAGDGASIDLRITVFSGIDGNQVAGAALAPFPVPLTDGNGVAHVYIAFTAASVIEVSTPSGETLGELVTRDAGWAELMPPLTLPSFVSERLSITGTSGDLLAGVVGEVIASGDEFSGLPAHGSLCAPGLEQKLARFQTGASAARPGRAGDELGRAFAWRAWVG